MEYKKTTNLLDNTPIQSSKFKTKNLVAINDESRGTYIEDNQIRFKTSIFSSGLCDYSDAYIVVKETLTLAAPTDSSNSSKKHLQQKIMPIKRQHLKNVHHLVTA